MKKTHIPYVVFGLLFTILFVLNGFQQKNFKEKTIIENHKYHNKSQKEKSIVENTTKNFYLIKENNEEIYLYDSKLCVVEKLNIDYKNLRQHDKNMFKNGMQFESLTEVYQLIEDFTN